MSTRPTLPETQIPITDVAPGSADPFLDRIILVPDMPSAMPETSAEEIANFILRQHRLWIQNGVAIATLVPPARETPAQANALQLGPPQLRASTEFWKHIYRATTIQATTANVGASASELSTRHILGIARRLDAQPGLDERSLVAIFTGTMAIAGYGETHQATQPAFLQLTSGSKLASPDTQPIWQCHYIPHLQRQPIPKFPRTKRK